MSDYPTREELDERFDRHKRECADGRAALYMPMPRLSFWLATLVPICLTIIALVGGAVYAYNQGVSANRERIATIENQVKGLEMSVSEIRHTTYKSRQLSEAVLEEVKAMRHEMRRVR